MGMPRNQILLVDDDPKLLRVLTLRLEAEGYGVIATSSGDEALQRLDNVRPRMVLADLRMPDLDGIELLSRIQSLLPSMGAASQRIGEFVIRNPAEVVHMSVSEVAERTQCSEGSVVGFCKLLGATGFQQLKIALAQQIVQPVQYIHEDLAAQDTPEQVVSKIFHSNIQTLQETESVLDVAALSAAVDLIRGARRVEIYGIGSSAVIARISSSVSTAPVNGSSAIA